MVLSHPATAPTLMQPITESFYRGNLERASGLHVDVYMHPSTYRPSSIHPAIRRFSHGGADVEGCRDQLTLVRRACIRLIHVKMMFAARHASDVRPCAVHDAWVLPTRIGYHCVGPPWCGASVYTLLFGVWSASMTSA